MVGEVHRVECAVRSDGTSPARAFLDDLKRGTWAADPEARGLPDDEQIRDYDKLLVLIQELARQGVPLYGGALNYLDHGVWELKIGTKRLTFFATAGHGVDEPRPRILDRRFADYPQDDAFWWLPALRPVLRLGTAFPKTGQTTDELDLLQAIQTRKEDLEHDRS